MKKYLRRIVIALLWTEMKITLQRFRPEIIAVTGSVGKTSTKDAIAAVLGTKFEIGKSPKSYNSEIGLPLAVLNAPNAFDSVLGWMYSLVTGFSRAFFSRSYPKLLVLEAGVDRPGDMDRTVNVIQPHIVVVTAIGEIPVHVEYFSGPEALQREKAKLLKGLTKENYAVLNADDETVKSMESKTKANVITFGFSAESMVRASSYRLTHRKVGKNSIPDGISFKVDYTGHTVPIRLQGVFGRQQAYVALAAIAVGIIKEMNLVEISETLLGYMPPPGRLRLIEGIRGSYIFDDTYNASPLATHAALDVLKDSTAERRICVLGDMLELGPYTIDAHKTVGALAAETCNVLVTVGARARFIAEEAVSKGLKKEAIFSFANSDEASQKITELFSDGDVLLVKGSQGMRMEKIVEALMLHPELAGTELVRQETFWKEKELVEESKMLKKVFGIILAFLGILFFFFAWPLGVIFLLVGAYVFRLRGS